MSVKDEFVDLDNRHQYHFKLGTVVATSLSGFIAGALVASIAWLLLIIAERV